MWVLAALVAVALLPCVVPQYYKPERMGWTVQHYPNPWYRGSDCNRANRSAICDPDNVISVADADEIDRLIKGVNMDTRCPCYHCVTNQKGYVIRVALMDDMQDLNNSVDVMDRLTYVRRFAYQLNLKWKLTGRCNETLLIVYSKKDNVLYTMTGSRARKLLTDDLIVEISVDVRPFFDDKETIAEGLKEMIRRYKGVFKKTYDRAEAGEVSHNRDRGGPNAAGVPTWSPLILITIATVLMS